MHTSPLPKLPLTARDEGGGRMWCRKGRARLIRSIPRIIYSNSVSSPQTACRPAGRGEKSGWAGAREQVCSRLDTAGQLFAYRSLSLPSVSLFRSAASEPPPPGASRSGPIESALEAPLIGSGVTFPPPAASVGGGGPGWKGWMLRLDPSEKGSFFPLSGFALFAPLYGNGARDFARGDGPERVLISRGASRIRISL